MTTDKSIYVRTARDDAIRWCRGIYAAGSVTAENCSLLRIIAHIHAIVHHKG